MKKIAYLGVAVVFLAVGCNKVASTTSTAPTTAQPTSQSQTNTNPTTTGTSATSNSDASLNSDLGTVDTQMNGLNTDNANANSAVSSQGQ